MGYSLIKKTILVVANNDTFGRWSLLLAGISYGAFWQSRYTSYELSVKDQKMKEKEAKLARLAAEKKAAADKEMAEFELIAKGSK